MYRLVLHVEQFDFRISNLFGPKTFNYNNNKFVTYALMAWFACGPKIVSTKGKCSICLLFVRRRRKFRTSGYNTRTIDIKKDRAVETRRKVYALCIIHAPINIYQYDNVHNNTVVMDFCARVCPNGTHTITLHHCPEDDIFYCPGYNLYYTTVYVLYTYNTIQLLYYNIMCDGDSNVENRPIITIDDRNIRLRIP